MVSSMASDRVQDLEEEVEKQKRYQRKLVEEHDEELEEKEEEIRLLVEQRAEANATVEAGKHLAVKAAMEEHEQETKILRKESLNVKRTLKLTRDKMLRNTEVIIKHNLKEREKKTKTSHLRAWRDLSRNAIRERERKHIPDDCHTGADGKTLFTTKTGKVILAADGKPVLISQGKPITKHGDPVVLIHNPENKSEILALSPRLDNSGSPLKLDDGRLLYVDHTQSTRLKNGIFVMQHNDKPLLSADGKVVTIRKKKIQLEDGTAVLTPNAGKPFIWSTGRVAVVARDGVSILGSDGTVLLARDNRPVVMSNGGRPSDSDGLTIDLSLYDTTPTQTTRNYDGNNIPDVNLAPDSKTLQGPDGRIITFHKKPVQVDSAGLPTTSNGKPVKIISYNGAGYALEKRSDATLKNGDPLYTDGDNIVRTGEGIKVLCNNDGDIVKAADGRVVLIQVTSSDDVKYELEDETAVVLSTRTKEPLLWDANTVCIVGGDGKSILSPNDIVLRDSDSRPITIDNNCYPKDVSFYTTVDNNKIITSSDGRAVLSMPDNNYSLEDGTPVVMTDSNSPLLWDDSTACVVSSDNKSILSRSGSVIKDSSGLPITIKPNRTPAVKSAYLPPLYRISSPVKKTSESSSNSSVQSENNSKKKRQLISVVVLHVEGAPEGQLFIEIEEPFSTNVHRLYTARRFTNSDNKLIADWRELIRVEHKTTGDPVYLTFYLRRVSSDEDGEHQILGEAKLLINADQFERIHHELQLTNGMGLLNVEVFYDGSDRGSLSTQEENFSLSADALASRSVSPMSSPQHQSVGTPRFPIKKQSRSVSTMTDHSPQLSKIISVLTGKSKPTELFKILQSIESESNWIELETCFLNDCSHFYGGMLLSAIEGELSQSDYKKCVEILSGIGIAATIPKKKSPLDSSKCATQLFKAMKGFGTDEDVVYTVLNSLQDESEWLNLRASFKELYKKFNDGDLVASLKSEFSASELMKAELILQSKRIKDPFATSSRSTKTSHPAAVLFKAMKGFGTDEDAIYEVLQHLSSQDDWDQLQSEFQSMYPDYHKGVLLSALSSEFTDSELTKAESILSKKKIVMFPKKVKKAPHPATILFKAMKGFGTDEDAIYEVLQNLSSQDEWKKLQFLFQDMYPDFHNGDLVAAMKSEFSASELSNAETALSKNGIAMFPERRKKDTHPATILFKAMKGFGTDEDAIYEVLQNLSSQDDWDQLQSEFQSMYPDYHKGVLLSALSSEFTTSELTKAESILSKKKIVMFPKKVKKAPHPATILFKAMKGFGTDEDAIYEVLQNLSSQDEWKKLQFLFQDMYPDFHNGDLVAAMKSEFSASELSKAETILLANGISMVLVKESQPASSILYKAMKGFGTDEDAVYKVLRSLTSQQEWDDLKLKFQTSYPDFHGGDIIAAFASEFSDSELQKIENILSTNGIVMFPKKVKKAPHPATILFKAMKGFGTDEDAIYEVLQNLSSQDDWDQLQSEFQSMYPDYHKGVLLSALSSEFTDSELVKAEAVLSRNGIAMFPKKKKQSVSPAAVLYKAMKGFGTDEDAIYEVLQNLSSQDDWDQLQSEFQSMYPDYHKGVLLSALSSEFTDSELVKAEAVLSRNGIAMFPKKKKQSVSPAAVLYKAMKGFGTDEDAIYEVLQNLSSQDDWESVKRDFQESYSDFHKGDLMEAMKSEFSKGEFKKAKAIIESKEIKLTRTQSDKSVSSGSSISSKLRSHSANDKRVKIAADGKTAVGLDGMAMLTSKGQFVCVTETGDLETTSGEPVFLCTNSAVLMAMTKTASDTYLDQNNVERNLDGSIVKKQPSSPDSRVKIATDGKTCVDIASGLILTVMGNKQVVYDAEADSFHAGMSDGQLGEKVFLSTGKQQQYALVRSKNEENVYLDSDGKKQTLNGELLSVLKLDSRLKVAADNKTVVTSDDSLLLTSNKTIVEINTTTGELQTPAGDKVFLSTSDPVLALVKSSENPDHYVDHKNNLRLLTGELITNTRSKPGFELDERITIASDGRTALGPNGTALLTSKGRVVIVNETDESYILTTGDGELVALCESTELIAVTKSPVHEHGFIDQNNSLRTTGGEFIMRSENGQLLFGQEDQLVTKTEDKDSTTVIPSESRRATVVELFNEITNKKEVYLWSNGKAVHTAADSQTVLSRSGKVIPGTGGRPVVYNSSSGELRCGSEKVILVDQSSQFSEVQVLIPQRNSDFVNTHGDLTTPTGEIIVGKTNDGRPVYRSFKSGVCFTSSSARVIHDSHNPTEPLSWSDGTLVHTNSLHQVIAEGSSTKVLTVCGEPVTAQSSSHLPVIQSGRVLYPIYNQIINELQLMLPTPDGYFINNDKEEFHKSGKRIIYHQGSRLYSGKVPKQRLVLQGKDNIFSLEDDTAVVLTSEETPLIWEDGTVCCVGADNKTVLYMGGKIMRDPSGLPVEVGDDRKIPPPKVVKSPPRTPQTPSDSSPANVVENSISLLQQAGLISGNELSNIRLRIAGGTVPNYGTQQKQIKNLEKVLGREVTRLQSTLRSTQDELSTVLTASKFQEQSFKLLSKLEVGEATERIELSTAEVCYSLFLL